MQEINQSLNTYAATLNESMTDDKSEFQALQDKYLKKQSELMAPVLEKMQKAIDELAIEKGYTYILNQSSGLNVLYVDPAHDLSLALQAKLK